MSKYIPRPLTGFKDLTPPEATVRQWLKDTWRVVTDSYGYEPYVVPTVEPRALYEAKSSGALVGESYLVSARGEDVGVLRPELTPSLVRQIAAVANSLPRPARRQSADTCFRAERPQKGRLREFLQLNVDIFGPSSSAADAEILSVAIDCLAATGLTSQDVSLRLSDRPLVTSLAQNLGIEDTQLQKLWPLIDALPKLGPDQTLLALAEILDADTAKSFLSLFQLPWAEQQAKAALVNPERTAWLNKVLELLDAQGLASWVTVDLSIVRGLGYYTGLVFEAFALGEPRALLGGGRYDNLVGSLGGPALPAAGFGLGETVLKDALAARNLLPSPSPSVDVFLAMPPSASAFNLARTLRAQNLRVALPQSEANPAKLADQALKNGIANIVQLGPNSSDSYLLKRRDQPVLCVPLETLLVLLTS